MKPPVLNTHIRKIHKELIHLVQNRDFAKAASVWSRAPAQYKAALSLVAFFAQCKKK